MDCPMRGARAVILYLLAALALSGCIRTAGPVAVAQPYGDLDAMAYGHSYGMPPAATRVAYAATDAGGP